MVQHIKDILQTVMTKDEYEIAETILDMINDVCVKEIEPYVAEIDEVGATLKDGKVISIPRVVGHFPGERARLQTSQSQLLLPFLT